MKNNDGCICGDWKVLVDTYELIKWHPDYHWILSWLEITKEKGYNQVHRYGISIKYCPMCGKKLSNIKAN